MPGRIGRMNALAEQFSHEERANRYHRWLTETLGLEQPLER